MMTVTTWIWLGMTWAVIISLTLVILGFIWGIWKGVRNKRNSTTTSTATTTRASWREFFQPILTPQGSVLAVYVLANVVFALLVWDIYLAWMKTWWAYIGIHGVVFCYALLWYPVGSQGDTGRRWLTKGLTVLAVVGLIFAIIGFSVEKPENDEKAKITLSNSWLGWDEKEVEPSLPSFQLPARAASPPRPRELTPEQKLRQVPVGTWVQFGPKEWRVMAPPAPGWTEPIPARKSGIVVASSKSGNHNTLLETGRVVQVRNGEIPRFDLSEAGCASKWQFQSAANQPEEIIRKLH